ncbi:hypothetical protein BDP27DRAFT_1403760 [Rhodocollybia butyracea]|uniref:Uncharacterized protein n=1 Tax=Rhodocollybia butyracea TaxID=206335 RepID=A0A9P5PQL3_9AGAR|nr:hypothetical protein BDP27DRAFT_1403760 [Rhodocollybia butyracea]
MSIDSSLSGGQANLEDIGDNRDSTASSGSSSSKSAESSTTATTTPDRSITSFTGDKLTRTASRRRSLAVLNTAVVPEVPPPLPSPKLPKSILSPSLSSPNLSNRARAYSLSRAPSVQFAPLPELAPRKRKSSVPLGVSARSSMMQKRRRAPVYVSAAASFDDPDYDNDLSPLENEKKKMKKKKNYVPDAGGMWTEEEAQEHLSRQLRIKEKERAKKLKRQQKELEKEAARAAFREKHGYDPPDEPEDDDPFNAFGKLMKEAWSKLGKTSKGKTKVDPHTRTQAEAETTQSAPRSPVAAQENESPPNEQRSADLEAKTEEEEEQDDGIDPYEVDVSKVVPLRSGSPPPSQFSGEDSQVPSSETSSITDDADSDSDSTRTCPTSPITTAPSSTTPTTNEFTFAGPPTPALGDISNLSVDLSDTKTISLEPFSAI